MLGSTRNRFLEVLYHPLVFKTSLCEEHQAAGVRTPRQQTRSVLLRTGGGRLGCPGSGGPARGLLWRTNGVGHSHIDQSLTGDRRQGSESQSGLRGASGGCQSRTALTGDSSGVAPPAAPLRISSLPLPSPHCTNIPVGAHENITIKIDVANEELMEVLRNSRWRERGRVQLDRDARGFLFLLSASAGGEGARRSPRTCAPKSESVPSGPRVSSSAWGARPSLRPTPDSGKG